MGIYAASGGYYIATAGKLIFANPLTVTGSIGIFYGKADVSELHEEDRRQRRDVQDDSARRRRVDLPPLHRGRAPRARDKVRQLYEIFVARVAEGRKMTPEAVDAVGQGRVWTGREACGAQGWSIA